MPFNFPEKISISKFISPDQMAIYERKAKNAVVDRAFSNAYYYNNNNWALVAYNLSLIGSDALLGCQSSVIVLDKNGNKVFQLDNLGININSAVVTNDGKYLCITYGSGDEYGRVLLNGYRIYNTINNKLIIEEKYPKEYLNNFLLEINFDLLFIQMRINNYEKESLLFVVYDFSKSERYKYEFKEDVYINFVEINKQGVVYKNPKGTSDTIYYRKNFKTEIINVQ